MQRKKVLGIGNTSATMLVEDTDGRSKVLKRFNVSGWSQEEIDTATNMYGLLARRKELARSNSGADHYDRPSSADDSDAASPFLIDVFLVSSQTSFINVLCEYAPSGDLASRLTSRTTPFDDDTVLRWGYHIALALHELHLLGFSHRSVNAASMFIDDDGCAKLGIPRPHRTYMARLEAIATSGRPSQNREGASPLPEGRQGMSDEVFPYEATQQGLYLGAQSDVWHWGAMMRELLEFEHHSEHFDVGRNESLVDVVVAALHDDAESRPTLDQLVKSLERLRGIHSSARKSRPQQHQQQEPEAAPRTRQSRAAAEYEAEHQHRQPASLSPDQHQAHDVNAARASRRRGASPDRGETAHWNARASMQFDELVGLQQQVRHHGRNSTSTVGGDPRPSASAYHHDPHEHQHSPEGHQHTPPRGSTRRTASSSGRHGTSAASRGGAAFHRTSSGPGTPTHNHNDGSQNVASMQHKLRTMGKANKMAAVHELDDLKQKRDEVRVKDQEAKRHQRDLHEREAASAHRAHMEKMRQIKNSRSSNIRKAAPFSHQHQQDAATANEMGVMRNEGVEIFVKNPATLDLSAVETGAAGSRRSARGPRRADDEELVNYVVMNERSQQPRQQQQQVPVASEAPPAPRQTAVPEHDEYLDDDEEPQLGGASYSAAPESMPGATDDELGPDSPMRAAPPQPMQRTPRGGRPSPDGYTDNEPHRPTVESVPSDSPPRRPEEPMRYTTRTSTVEPEAPLMREIRVASSNANEARDRPSARPSHQPRHQPEYADDSPPRQGRLSAGSDTLAAVVSGSIQALQSSLSRELGPGSAALTGALQFIDDFAALPVDERAMPYRNKQLVNKLTECVGETTAPVVLPMLLQLASLEATMVACRELDQVYGR